MEKQPFEDVFPIEYGYVSLLEGMTYRHEKTWCTMFSSWSYNYPYFSLVPRADTTLLEITNLQNHWKDQLENIHSSPPKKTTKKTTGILPKWYISPYITPTKITLDTVVYGIVCEHFFPLPSQKPT